MDDSWGTEYTCRAAIVNMSSLLYLHNTYPTQPYLLMGLFVSRERSDSSQLLDTIAYTMDPLFRCNRMLWNIISTFGRRTVSTQILLQDNDLPREDPDFLRVITKQHWLQKFGENPPLIKIYSPYGNPHRLFVIMALFMKSGNAAIPIPFLIDTGAPSFAYLGSGAINRLLEEKAIIEVHGRYTFQLQGNLCRETPVLKTHRYSWYHFNLSNYV